MSNDRIPFNKPGFTGSELDYIRRALDQGYIAGNGPFAKKCEKLLKEELGAARILLTTSCTHALEMAALLLNIEPGDEVIVPSFTFVSTVNAFILRGARPVFVDIRKDTLNIDERLIENVIGPRTKALVVVHYGGVGCEMDAISAITRSRNIALVEDNAHGLFGKYRGKALGAFAPLATLSFHETKNISCGEGGALVINDEKFIDRAEIIREKGTDRNRFFRGEVDKYTWRDIGSSYVLSDMNAAFLLAQLENKEDIQRRRTAIWNRYFEQLGDWAGELGIALPHVPDHCLHPSHMFYLLLPSMKWRDALIGHLKSCGILGVFHYLPLHMSIMGRSFDAKAGDCPVTEDISGRLLRLPFFYGLTNEEHDRVIEALKSFASPPGEHRQGGGT